MTRCYNIIAAIMLCLLADTARADSRVAVRPFFGPHAGELRTKVLSLFKGHPDFEVVPTAEVEKQAKRLSVNPDSTDGRVTLARELRVDMWIAARVQWQGRNLRATVLTYDGRGPQPIARTVVKRRTPRELTGALERAFWRENSDELLRAAGPRAKTKGDDNASTQPTSDVAAVGADMGSAAASEESPDPNVPAATTAPSGTTVDHGQPFSSEGWTVVPTAAPNPEPTRDALITSFTVGTFTRHLKYRDAQTLGLGDYRLPIAPQGSLDARYFPAAHFTARWPSYFGLEVNAQLALAGNSQTKDGKQYPTWGDAYGAGGCFRLPIGRHEASVVAGYGVRRLMLRDSKASPSPTPDVDYRYLRTGVQGAFAISEKLHLAASATWLYLLSGGELTSAGWFPRTTGGGFEASVLGSYGLTEHLDFVATLGLAHFFLSFQPETDDPKVAGGATDDFVTGGLGIRFRL